MKILVLIAAFLLASCVGKKSVVVKYDLQSPVKIEVFSQSHYATLDDDGVEQIGTITETYFNNEYSQAGETLFLEREFRGDASKGYLKKSYPGELALRIPNLKITANGIRVINIEGYEHFDSLVVAKVTIPERWKRQISRMTRQIDLDRIERRRWEITHLLLGEVPLNSNVTALVAGRIPKMPHASIDSVVTKGVREIDGRKCLEYIVYLQEKELFPYFIWEQHIATVSSGKNFKSYDNKDAFYKNRYEVALNLKNGIPCLEREYKLGEHGMQHPETKDSVVFKSQISHERLYKVL